MTARNKVENLDDESLVVFVREKDKQAYEIIIDRYQEKLWHYINRLVNNPIEAEDLTQQALVNAYIHLRDFDKDKKFSSWVYRIAHNLSVNWIKKKKASFSIEGSVAIARKLSSEGSISERVLKKEAAEKLQEAVGKIPLKFKEPLVLKYLENKSYDEISYILRKPKSTIGTMISRAKKMIKEELKKTYE